MALESLFLKEISDQDSSSTKLPHDVTGWDEVLITKLIEKVPELQGMIIKPKLTHTSEENGTAVGSIVVMEQKTQKTVFVPVIIKNFQLFPLDVMLVTDVDQNYSTAPLTSETIVEALENSQPFNHLEKPIDRIQELYFNPQNAHVFPPYLRNVHASSGALDYIASSITPLQKKAFFAELKANPSVLVGYEKRSNLHLLKKVADTAYEPWEEQDHNNPKIIHMKAHSNGEMALTSTDTDMFNPIVDIGKIKGGFDQHYPKDMLNEVLVNGEKIIATEYDQVNSSHIYHGREMLGPHESPGAYTNADDPVTETNTFGRYKIQGLDGIQYTGIVFPNVFDFDGKETGLKIFYNSSCHSIQTSFAGIYIDGSTPRNLETMPPVYGVTGCLVCIKGDRAVALSPVTIRGTADYDNGLSMYKAVDMRGNPVRFCMNYPGNKIVPVDGVWQIPEHYHFISLKNFKPMTETVELANQKIAAATLDANPIRLIHKGHNEFALKGSGISKMATDCNWSANDLSPGQVAFILASRKCPMDKIAFAIKSASTYYDGVTIHGLPQATAYTGPKVMPTMSPVNLVKEASYIDDSQVVDTLLGLNFINPENIQKFHSMIPLLKMASDKLAQLLLASRLGMSEIPGSACVTAMYKVVEVIKGLERLKLHIEDSKAGA